MIKSNEELNKLVNDHWNYILGLLVAHNVTDDIIKACEYHYKTAFIHGWKHAMENRND